MLAAADVDAYIKTLPVAEAQAAVLAFQLAMGPVKTAANVAISAVSDSFIGDYVEEAKLAASELLAKQVAGFGDRSDDPNGVEGRIFSGSKFIVEAAAGSGGLIVGAKALGGKELPAWRKFEIETVKNYRSSGFEIQDQVTLRFDNGKGSRLDGVAWDPSVVSKSGSAPVVLVECKTGCGDWTTRQAELLDWLNKGGTFTPVGNNAAEAAKFNVPNWKVGQPYTGPLEVHLVRPDGKTVVLKRD